METNFPTDTGYQGFFLVGYRKDPAGSGAVQRTGTVLLKRAYTIASSATDPAQGHITPAAALPVYVADIPNNLVRNGDFEATQIPVSYTTRFALPGVPAGTPVNALLAPQFTGSGRLAPQSVGTEITLPDQLVFGIAIKPTDRAKFFVDYQWVNWADFDQLVLEFSGGLGTVSQNENYENTHGIRVATELGVTDRFVVRGGILAHKGAAPDETVTPLLPEGYRNEFAGGFGFDLTSSIRLDGAIQYIDQRDRRGRTIPELPDGTVVNNGLYTFDAYLYGFSIVWKF